MSDVARFLDGLRRQRSKYAEMAAVAAEQRRALEASDMDALLRIVERKRALLADIATIDRDVAPYRAGWDTLKASVDAVTAREIETEVAAMRDMLKDLVRQEDEGRAALEKRRETEAVDLQTLLAKAKARGAYGR
ncbi:MAG TPA: flagellar export chaperone FlgN [Planctomycetota bacterium]